MNDSEIRSHLTTHSFGQTIHTYDVLDSTNVKAKSFVLDGAIEGTIILADRQTAGRGRLGRTWLSEPGKNLTFSLILRPNISPQHIGILSLYAGFSVASAIEHLTGISPTCKWPNDVLLDQKKCCGILSEIVFLEKNQVAIVVGIGININQEVFPGELHERATSLSLASGKPFGRLTVLAETLKRLEENYTFIQTGAFSTIIDNWKRYSALLGASITVDQSGTYLSGIASRLADDGGLIITTEGKEVKVLAGDVTVIS